MIKILIELECDFCNIKVQTTGEIELDRFQESGEDKIELKINPTMPEGWSESQAFWTKHGHKCPKHI